MNPEVAACAARFKVFHSLNAQSATALKLGKYFAGLEVHALYDLHDEIYGESRGGDRKSDAAKIKTEGASVLILQDFLEQHLGVTARTARKYRDWFLSVSGPAENAALTKRLNKWWCEHKPLALTAGSEGAQALSLQSLSAVTATDLQAILNAPDEWDLHELFEAPLRDVTPDADAEDEPDQRDAALKFWHDHFLRRLGRKDYLRLPKPVRERLATSMEEMITELKDTLKPAKKRGKKAA